MLDPSRRAVVKLAPMESLIDHTPELPQWPLLINDAHALTQGQEAILQLLEEASCGETGFKEVDELEGSGWQYVHGRG